MSYTCLQLLPRHGLRANPFSRCSLVNLYNSVSGKAQKLSVFSKLIQYAGETKHMDALAPYLASAQSWKSKWGLTTREAGDLFLTISTCLEKVGNLEEAQVFLIRYLATFEGEPVEIRKEALPSAKKAALNFIKAPAVSQRSNLAALAVVSTCGARVHAASPARKISQATGRPAPVMRLYTSLRRSYHGVCAGCGMI